jgi:hypothetical protein
MSYPLSAREEKRKRHIAALFRAGKSLRTIERDDGKNRRDERRRTLGGIPLDRRPMGGPHRLVLARLISPPCGEPAVLERTMENPL